MTEYQTGGVIPIGSRIRLKVGEEIKPMPPATPTELLLHRAAQWQRRFVADHGVGYDDDPTFRLVRDLANALETCTRGK